MANDEKDNTQNTEERVIIIDGQKVFQLGSFDPTGLDEETRAAMVRCL